MKVNGYFKNKNYVIIGAANGFGKSLACDLADKKANLFLFDIDKSLKKLCQDLSKKTKCKGNTFDLINYHEAAEKIIKMLGPQGFDGFVYFPRGRQKYPYSYLNEERFRNDLSLNVESLMYIFHKLWKKKKVNKNASVVFISSVTANYIGSESISYSMSKSALESMCRYLAVEFGPKNHIRINSVQLGYIVKDEFKEKFYSENNKDYKFWAQRIQPLRRVGHNKDVVDPIKFLLSDAASFMTGQVLVIDGGLSIQEHGYLVREFMRDKEENS